ncbi:hypothetical protein EDB83DRAFT_2324678 [Lactarius deliciosus]|nr:hypothetical protein EDB83DRAFT_2324678 [Lactarius deliciosus]
MLHHIRDGNTNLIHIAVQAANCMGGAHYAVLDINQPLFECLKGYFMLFNLLFDQALLKVQGTTLQLGKGATITRNGCETWEEGGSDKVQDKSWKWCFWVVVALSEDMYGYGGESTGDEGKWTRRGKKYSPSFFCKVDLPVVTVLPYLTQATKKKQFREHPTTGSSDGIGITHQPAMRTPDDNDNDMVFDEGNLHSSLHSCGPAACTPYNDSDLTAAAPNRA